MNDPENFLSRWSRRKRESELAPEVNAAESAADAGLPIAAPEAPAFDLASLPSLDSIGADTDVSVFMKPGVPATLRDAALRRAWASDPAIRDFRGLQENGWDFTDPQGVPGFGRFTSEDEVRELAQRLFGGATDTEQVSQSVPGHEAVEATQEVSVPPQQAADDSRDRSLGVQDAAPKDEPAAVERYDDDGGAPPSKRRHGGALPQ